MGSLAENPSLSALSSQFHENAVEETFDGRCIRIKNPNNSSQQFMYRECQWRGKGNALNEQIRVGVRSVGGEGVLGGTDVFAIVQDSFAGEPSQTYIEFRAEVGPSEISQTEREVWDQSGSGYPLRGWINRIVRYGADGHLEVDDGNTFGTHQRDLDAEQKAEHFIRRRLPRRIDFAQTVALFLDSVKQLKPNGQNFPQVGLVVSPHSSRS